MTNNSGKLHLFTSSPRSILPHHSLQFETTRRGERLKVLIVEDEKKVADALKEGLEAEGFDADVSYTGEDGFFKISTHKFDIIVLDWMLPGRDGIEVLSFIRKLGLKTPVLFLTARDSIADRTMGLNKGADDYLIKPFAVPELVA